MSASQQPPTSSADATAREISEWLKKYMSELLSLPASDINTATTFDRYGLDSSAAVGMTGDLGDWLGIEVDTAAPYEHPTIEKLSRALASDKRLLARRAAQAGKATGS
ncbi:acyl carrier protein [Corallococcus coralloides DSM 2259]|uniref:Acyl carrier protein n=1 Tax=Corallococcus coralloides (strain ATCC 25202 / DSM 2259 / NBRC 100086 / M2) TaxID=1144275 RepID=H8MRD4_CORCM|nr:acyl carrier protein [Corallococcus coralloides]AFE06197.1 acyl carrier protein [Corallococcus coralloides DSM 2259]